LALALLAAVPLAFGTAAAQQAQYEVWAVDQSDTIAAGGGTLYIYDGAELAADAATATPEVINLGGDINTFCEGRTTTRPRRPHMFMFDTPQKHAILAYVATGHVLFLDAVTREPLECIDVGVQAHAAIPLPNGKAVLVANQNGKLLQRINSDFAHDEFTLDNAATLDLATCTTPSGAPCQAPGIRPDNAPICVIPDRSSRFLFVTLRGGGMFVVDPNATPMAIVAEYDMATVRENGCGGLQVGNKMFVNSGAASLAAQRFDVYAFRIPELSLTPSPPNTPAPTVVVRESKGDGHGIAETKAGHFLWFADRHENEIAVVDPERDEVVNTFSLIGPLSIDPAPDLLGTSLDGHFVFATLRSATPLTGGATATGSTPGVGVMRVDSVGSSGTLSGIAPITNTSGFGSADPHALAVRHH
jgi:DNA-binding beta-propeller fold protein YncE